MDQDHITASELAEYVYCQCCWLDTLQGNKVQTAQMLEGSIAHERVQSSYVFMKFLRRIAVTLIVSAVCVAVVVFVIRYIGGYPLW